MPQKTRRLVLTIDSAVSYHETDRHHNPLPVPVPTEDAIPTAAEDWIILVVKDFASEKVLLELAVHDYIMIRRDLADENGTVTLGFAPGGNAIDSLKF